MKINCFFSILSLKNLNFTFFLRLPLDSFVIDSGEVGIYSDRKWKQSPYTLCLLIKGALPQNGTDAISYGCCQCLFRYFKNAPRRECGSLVLIHFSGINGPRHGQGLLPESAIWSYIVQLSSALRTIHAAGLACRVMDPTKILLTDKSRWITNFPTKKIFGTD